MLWIPSGAQPSLKIESANRLFRSMILPILDYCGAVFHGFGKRNTRVWNTYKDEGGRILLNTAHLSTEQMVTSLGWDTQVSSQVGTLKGDVPSYFSKQFQLRRHNILDYGNRIKSK